EVVREETARSISSHYGIEWKGEYSNVQAPQKGISSSSSLTDSFLEARFDPCFLSDLDEVALDSSSSSISSSARPLASVFSPFRSEVSARCPRNCISLALTSALVRGLPSRSVYCSRRNRPST